MDTIFDTIDSNAPINREQAAALLDLPVMSAGYYRLLQLANAYSRKAFGGRGAIFAQIGLDAQPCPVNCKFCSLSKYALGDGPAFIKSKESVLALAGQLVEAGADELFLMSTAAYDAGKFLEMAAAVKALLPEGMRFVANVGDFDDGYAGELKKTGFTGVYHICRLGEGRDTEVQPAARMRTLDAVKRAGLELYYCVEPIGPEHTNDELIAEMERIRDYPVEVMAAMKRVGVPGTPLADKGEISAARLAQICAVTTLCCRPKRAMGIHEPDELCLMSGANQIYAECGVNPRDKSTDTEQNRGFSVDMARALLQKAEWTFTH